MEEEQSTSPSTADDRSILSEPAWVVRRAAFRGILETGAPWDPKDARDLPLDGASVGAAIAQLVDAGRVCTDGGGGVVVTSAGGLNTGPTAHRIQIAAGSRWTDCAYDALGILGALGADGLVDSRSPATGASIRVRFERGRPVGSTAVLFLADESCCVRPNEEWCPNVNLFEDAVSARTWAAERGIEGRVVSLEEGTDLGTAEWRPLVDGLERLGGAGDELDHVEGVE